MRTKSLIIAVLAMMLAPQVAAQEKLDQVSEVYWHTVRMEKKAWVENNMRLSKSEAEKFWPLYEQYQKDLAPVLRQLKETLETYGERYQQNSLTDNDAQQLMGSALKAMQQDVNLRMAYLGKMSKLLPGNKAARYVQLEGRLVTVIMFELAQHVPLAGDTKQPAAKQ